jgi:N-acylneuraminate cytidylyltransferase
VTEPSLIALVPARSGSQRVPGKNVRRLGGHPLLAYAIATARHSEEIAEIARWYGADVPFLRPAEYATPTSPDVDWITDTLRRLPERYDLFAIVRPTSPFRGPDAVRRGLDQLLATPAADSIRAVEPVKQHPGKMWVVESDAMRPLLDQDELDVPWHSSQYQALPRVYVQNGALEIAWTRVLDEGRHAGRVVAPFLTDGYEGFNIDDEEDWARAEALVEAGTAQLLRVESQ